MYKEIETLAFFSILFSPNPHNLNIKNIQAPWTAFAVVDSTQKYFA
jgi:hypothetical protein